VNAKMEVDLVTCPKCERDRLSLATDGESRLWVVCRSCRGLWAPLEINAILDWHTDEVRGALQSSKTPQPSSNYDAPTREVG